MADQNKAEMTSMEAWLVLFSSMESQLGPIFQIPIFKIQIWYLLTIIKVLHVSLYCVIIIHMCILVTSILDYI